MVKNKGGNKVYIVHLNSIVYGVIFLIILMSTIYFISIGMGDSEVIIQSTGAYQNDQLIAIEAVANNVTGRINNIIAVSAIFFVVVVSSISVFQFIKVKDFDKEINNLLKETQMLNIDLDLSKSKLDGVMENLTSSKVQIDELKDEINKIYKEKNNIKLDNVRTQLEFNIHRINEELHKKGSNFSKNVALIDKSIDLSIRYPEAIDKIEVSKLYYKRATILNDYNMSGDALYIANIALDKVKEKYPNMHIFDIMERIYVEGLVVFIINIHSKNGDLQLVKKVIEEMSIVIEDEIKDRIAYLNLSPLEEVIEFVTKNNSVYGEYFIKIFKEEYKTGKFSCFENSSEFRELIKSLNIGEKDNEIDYSEL